MDENKILKAQAEFIFEGWKQRYKSSNKQSDKIWNEYNILGRYMKCSDIKVELNYIDFYLPFEQGLTAYKKSGVELSGAKLIIPFNTSSDPSKFYYFEPNEYVKYRDL